MKSEFKYITEISNYEFETHVVLPFINENGDECIFIRNSKNKTVLSRGSTDNLEYRLNSTLYKDGIPYYFHLIICTNNDTFSKEQFSIAYKYLFQSINTPQSDFEIMSLMNALEQLFAITPERDKSKLQTGIYGELLAIHYLHEAGASRIVSKYHSDFYSKHDFELDRYNRIEVKSTVGSERIHHFSLDQLNRNDINVYLISVILEKSTEGISLNDLFSIVEQYVYEPDAIMKLGKLKALCGVNTDAPGPSYSFDKAMKDVRIFNSKDIPHLSLDGIKGILNVSYDVDCSFANEISTCDFVNEVNSLIGE